MNSIDWNAKRDAETRDRDRRGLHLNGQPLGAWAYAMRSRPPEWCPDCGGYLLNNYRVRLCECGGDK